MEANELRVDNWVNSPYGFVLISEIQHAQCTIRKPDFSVNVGEWYNKIEPIPLTEEILMKCGFEKYDQKSAGVIYEKEPLDFFITKHGDNYVLGHFDNEAMSAMSYFMHGNIQFIHQLQNAFYCLTGQELTVNL